MQGLLSKEYQSFLWELSLGGINTVDPSMSNALYVSLAILVSHSFSSFWVSNQIACTLPSCNQSSELSSWRLLVGQYRVAIISFTFLLQLHYWLVILLVVLRRQFGWPCCMLSFGSYGARGMGAWFVALFPFLTFYGFSNWFYSFSWCKIKHPFKHYNLTFLVSKQYKQPQPIWESLVNSPFSLRTFRIKKHTNVILPPSLYITKPYTALIPTHTNIQWPPLILTNKHVDNEIPFFPLFMYYIKNEDLTETISYEPFNLSLTSDHKPRDSYMVIGYLI